MIRTFYFVAFLFCSIFITSTDVSGLEFPDDRKVWEFPIEVTTKDGGGNPVPEVPVYVDGKLAGKTGSRGIFKAVISERHRAFIKLGVGKVEGYKLHIKQAVEASFQLIVTNPKDPIPGKVKLKIRFKKISQDNLVWVALSCKRGLSCSGIDILSKGEAVATTNEFGVAHFVNNSVPDSRIELTIDTPSPTDDIVFSPSNPKFTFKSSLKPSIYFIEESFLNAKPQKKTVRAYRGKESRRKTKRYRRKTKRKKTKVRSVKKKKKKKGAIDLW